MTLQTFAELRLGDVATALGERYVVERVLGVGGMADVYLATDTRHARRIAIKVMRRETVGATGRERFEREIGVAARLSHPNIVPLFDSGHAGVFTYFVMPFVDGPTLREHLASSGPLAAAEAIRLGSEIGAALAYAHRSGIVHRDIKPANILLEHGHARITDFGVSKALFGDLEQITTGQSAIGTLSYMSPEQATASATADERADQYALAVVIYEMLCGRTPFPNGSVEQVFALKALGRFTPIAALSPNVSRETAVAIDRALSADPDQRFESIDAFIAALNGTATHGVRRGWSRLVRPTLGIGALIMLTGVLIRLANRRPEAGAVPSSHPIGRIIVVPLYNGTEEKSLDVVGLMAGDWLTEGLQKVGLLDVAPTTSGFSLDSGARRPTTPAGVLTDETGAQTLVRGAYYRRGDSLLFRVQITDARANKVIGSVTDVVAPMADPVRGIEELRNRLMGWLAARYDDRLQDPAAKPERAPTYAAYRAFSEGMNAYISNQNARAYPLFMQAYAADTSFIQALLYATLASTNTALTNTAEWSHADSLLSVIEKRGGSLSAFDRALLNFRIGTIRQRPDISLAGVREADRLAPGTKSAYNHAVVAFQTAHVHEALRAIQTLRPDRGAMRGFAPYWSIYGSILHALGDFDAERKVGREARGAYPDRLIVFPAGLRAAAATGDISQLDEQLAAASALSNDPYYWDYGLLLTEVAEELRAHGHPDDANRYWTALDEWLSHRDTTNAVHWRRAVAKYALGQFDAAESIIQRLSQNGTTVDYLGMRGTIAARRGRAGEARAISDSLEHRTAAYQLGLPQLYQARIAALLGDGPAAITQLQRAFAEERPYQVWLHRDIDLEGIRNTPAFMALLRGRDDDAR